MKKINFCIVLAMLFITAITNLSSCGFLNGELEFELNQDEKSYSVVGIGDCKDTDLVIPAEYNGLPVTSISDFAFYSYNKFISIEIPDSVTSIGGSAFYGCNKLNRIIMSKNITTIGSYAFMATGFTSVELPEGIKEIGERAFANCRLEKVTIPESVISIGSGAFSGCQSLTSLTVSDGNMLYHSSGNCLIETGTKRLISGCLSSIIPTDGSVTSIGDYAFSGCENLVYIEIPSSVTNIGFDAFAFCYKLENIQIPYSVEDIDYRAFFRCEGIKSIAVDPRNLKYYSSGNCLINTITNTLIRGCNNSIIPEGVTSIGDNAFSGCTTMTNIKIPRNVTEIGADAFSFCDNLMDIYYNGTKSEWNKVKKNVDWARNTGDYTIHCTDGDIKK